MKVLISLSLLVSLLVYSCFADPVRSSLTSAADSESEASPRIWTCGRYMMLSAVTNNPSSGIRLRGAFFAIARPSVLRVFIHSDEGFNPMDEEQSSAMSSDSNPDKLAYSSSSGESVPQDLDESVSSEANPNRASVSSDFDSISRVAGSGGDAQGYTEMQTASETEGKAEPLVGSAASTDSAKGELANVNTEALEGADSSEIKYSEADNYPIPHFFFFRKMLLPLGSSAGFLSPRFSDPWERVRTMELQKLREATNGYPPDEKFGEQRIERSEVYDNGDGTFTVHRTISFPHNEIPFEVSSNKFLNDAAADINAVARRVKSGFLASFLDAFNSFYNSMYGTIILGIACGLVLSLISFFIMSLFFPEENDEERTVFILSTDTPSTPLLEENPSSDADSVSSGQSSPRAANYQPPSVN